MKRKITNVVSTVFSVAAALLVISAQAEDDLKTESQQAVSNFLSTDPSLKKFVDESSGYAIFPSVGKGGFVVGGAHGKGLLYEKGVATGETSMTQASIGAQVGGQSFAEIIFFQTPQAVTDFKSGKFEMSADVSAVAAAQGAAKSADYKNGVAVFTLPKKGLMVQASVGGQKFKFEPLQPTGR
ncbi:MAG TPA: YSC84-related protein [Verrucomicrobiae bacterium]|nr:YSC84-related protein [Verrucomicrobiae bacterium]